jgi:hypothetical protein
MIEITCAELVKIYRSLPDPEQWVRNEQPDKPYCAVLLKESIDLAERIFADTTVTVGIDDIMFKVDLRGPICEWYPITELKLIPRRR